MTGLHRLTGRRQFAAVLAAGTVARSGHLRVHAAPNGGQAMRAGYAIRGVGAAVVRNRLRRRFRVVVRERAQACRGIDIVVGAGPAAADQPFTAIRHDLQRCLDRVVPRVLRGSALSPDVVRRPAGDNGGTPPPIQWP